MQLHDLAVTESWRRPHGMVVAVFEDLAQGRLDWGLTAEVSGDLLQGDLKPAYSCQRKAMASSILVKRPSVISSSEPLGSRPCSERSMGVCWLTRSRSVTEAAITNARVLR